MIKASCCAHNRQVGFSWPMMPLARQSMAVCFCLPTQLTHLSMQLIFIDYSNIRMYKDIAMWSLHPLEPGGCNLRAVLGIFPECVTAPVIYPLWPLSPCGHIGCPFTEDNSILLKVELYCCVCGCCKLSGACFAVPGIFLHSGADPTLLSVRSC